MDVAQHQVPQKPKYNEEAEEDERVCPDGKRRPVVPNDVLGRDDGATRVAGTEVRVLRQAPADRGRGLRKLLGELHEQNFLKGRCNILIPLSCGF